MHSRWPAHRDHHAAVIGPPPESFSDELTQPRQDFGELLEQAGPAAPQPGDPAQFECVAVDHRRDPQGDLRRAESPQLGKR
jgi:hypothetical protein